MAAYEQLSSTEKLLGQSTDSLRFSIDAEDAIRPARESLSLLAKSFRTKLHIMGIQLFLLALNISVCALYVNLRLKTPSCQNDTYRLNAPAAGALEFEPRKFETRPLFMSDGTLNPNRPTQYSGDPRPELHEAWENLAKYTNVRVHEEELGQFRGDDSLIKLSDDSGYYASTAAFHGLHCIKRLHHFVHQDYYYANLSTEDIFLLQRHTEHCMDWLRQYIQCNPDLTLIMMHWGVSQPLPLAYDGAKHMCAKWSSVEDWAESRYFDPREPGLLVHPVFGASNGTKDHIGISKGEEFVHGTS